MYKTHCKDVKTFDFLPLLSTALVDEYLLKIFIAIADLILVVCELFPNVFIQFIISLYNSVV